MRIRHLRIDVEYDVDANPLRLYSYRVVEVVNAALRAEAPAARVVFTRDAPDAGALDGPRGRHGGS